MELLDYTLTCFVKKYRTNANGEAPIYLKIRIGNRKMELSSKQFINPTCWNPVKERVEDSPGAASINAIISKMKSDLNKVITNLYVTGEGVDISAVKQYLEFGTLKKDHSLLEVVTEHNKQFEKQIGVRYSYGSYKNYKTTLAFLKEFIRDEYKNGDIPLKNVNHKFCERFFIWLTSVKTCNQNGAGKHLQRLKTISNYGYKMGYVQENPIRNYTLSFKTPAREALTWDEIKKIERLKLTDKTLENIRHILLFQVYTGLSYADVKVFSMKHVYKGIGGNLWLKMERTKTHNTFTLPLVKPALSILDKYADENRNPDTPVFPVLSNQKMNYYLKLIQQLTGINKNFHTHLFRHTFASTVTLQSGVPLETVSKMLGHSKITMTQVYARVGEVKIAADMRALGDKLSGK